MTHLPRVALVAAVAALGAVAYAALVAARDEIVLAPRVESGTLVEVLTVEARPVELAVDLFGRVEAAREARLSAEVSGRVARIAPDATVGARVAAGAVLVELDRADLELARITAEARVAEAEAALTRERAEAAIARRDLERAGVSDPDPLALREPQLAGAEAALASARAALDRARLDLRRTTLSAPFDALVTAERVNLGQVVAPGTALLDLVATDAFEVRLPLVDRDRALLEPLGVGAMDGPTVTLELDTWGPPARFVGRIVRTLPELDPSSRALVAIARVEDPLGGPTPLRLGDFVRAHITGRTVRDAVSLPESAVRTGDQVWLAGPDDRLERRSIRVALRADGVAIVEAGLEPGDRVIVSALEAASEGQALDVRATEAAVAAGSSR